MARVRTKRGTVFTAPARKSRSGVTVFKNGKRFFYSGASIVGNGSYSRRRRYTRRRRW